MSEPPDYEPRPEESVAARAVAAGIAPEEMLFDLLMKDGGQGIVYLPLTNYGTGDLDDDGRSHPQRQCAAGAWRCRGPCRDDLRRIAAHLHAHPLGA